MKYIVSRDPTTGADVICVYVKGKQFIVNSSHVNYRNIVAAVKSHDEDALLAALDLRETIRSGSDGRVVVDSRGVMFDGQPLHSALANRIHQLFTNGFDVAPLMAFLTNLDANPSKRAVDELYGFLEACNLPITEDGHFIAYKMVNADYTSIYDGSFRNDIGTVVEMTRNRVDDNKDRTCSQGLHFASRYYVESGGYGSRNAGHRLVAVKVNPADVVSIPSDYNNSKGRACKYLILEELDWETELDSYFGTPSHNNEQQTFDNSFFTDEYDEDESDDCDDVDDDSERDLRYDADGNWRSDELLPGSSVLTYGALQDILDDLSDDSLTIAAIARQYGISSRQVARIRDGEAYASLTGR